MMNDNKFLDLFRLVQRESGRRDRRAPARKARQVGAGCVLRRRDPLPEPRKRPRRRCLHHAVALRRQQFPHHGTAADGRRFQARLGAAHHRRDHLLRLRPPGPQGQAAGGHFGTAAGRPAGNRRLLAGPDHRPSRRPDPGLFQHPGGQPDGPAGIHLATSRR